MRRSGTSANRVRAACLLTGTLTLACEAVLGGPDYRIMPAADETDRLIKRFGSDSPACGECMGAGECGQAFARCAASPECVGLVECSTDRPSPAKAAECEAKLAPPEDARDSFSTLHACSKQCVVACQGGHDFSCAGAYTFKRPQSATIRLTQTLRFLLAPEKPVEGLEISICRPGVSCDDPMATATTDQNGTYAVEIPIRTTPISEAGFRGYRLVHGEPERLPPHRIQSNLPFFSDRGEETGIVSEEVSRQALTMLGSANPSILLLQIMDCRSVGARGIFFELSSAGARIEYLQGVAQWGPGPTLAAQEGAAFVLDLEPGTYHDVRAVTDTGELVAVDRVYMPGDSIVMSQLLPRAAE